MQVSRDATTLYALPTNLSVAPRQITLGAGAPVVTETHIHGRVPASCVCYSPNSRFAAVARGDQALIFSVADWSLLQTVQYDVPVTSLLYTGDGQFLVSTTEAMLDIHRVQLDGTVTRVAGQLIGGDYLVQQLAGPCVLLRRVGALTVKHVDPPEEVSTKIAVKDPKSIYVVSPAGDVVAGAGYYHDELVVAVLNPYKVLAHQSEELGLQMLFAPSPRGRCCCLSLSFRCTCSTLAHALYLAPA